MLSILCVRLTIKVKVGIPESFKVGWYPPKKTGSSHLKGAMSPHTHARANENKLEKVGPTFSSCVGDFGRLFLSV